VSEVFSPQEIIRKKRDGWSLSDDEIQNFVATLTDGTASEGQVGAFAMAVFFNSMSAAECTALTLAMRDSGEVLQWDRERLRGPVIDKHSTGGVGDCVSLMLAPMLAACGAHVPMISGRGLGHTGGTLDKLASIPGYSLTPDPKTFCTVVENTGCAIIGQTAALAPADSRLYAVRDVTATVESVALITASILSKKLAAGLDALVMDIKVGNGAFMSDLDEARSLAASINRVARQADLQTCALITDMNQPLAPVAGNALEVKECVAYLTGERRDTRLHEVVIGLGAALLVCSGVASDEVGAREQLKRSLVSGEALERFNQMIEALGGPADFSSDVDVHLPCAPVIQEVLSLGDGFISQIDTRSLGMAVVSLGGGRRHPEDAIDPVVGLDSIIRTGERARLGDLLCRVHAPDESMARYAAKTAQEAIHIDSVPSISASPILERAL
jgi:thymidine phosphorylase